MKIICKIGLPVLLSLVLMACGSESSEFDTEVAINVSVDEVKEKAIEQTLITTGTVIPTFQFLGKSEMTGAYRLQTNQQSSTPYKMGDRVKKGDLIIKLEDREYENATNLEGAKLDLEISEMEYQKQQALYEKGGVTLRELVNSEKALVTAKKTHENAQINLNKMNVYAPFNGVITDLPYYSEGMRIETGQDLLSIMDYSTLVMELMLPENLMGKVRQNQVANIMNYALPDDTLKGIISELSPAIDQDTRSFKGRITIDNQQLILRPGMFVKAEVVVASRSKTIVIPKDVVLTEGNRRVVFIANRESAQKRYVKVGLENETEMEILDGLKVNERLIVKGFETLRDRSKIKVVQ
jgi:RND family efflux transporter MFP subunit